MTSPAGTPRTMPMDIGVAQGLNEGNVDEKPTSSTQLPGIPDSPEPGQASGAQSPGAAQQEIDLKYFIMNLQAEVSELKKKLEEKPHDKDYEEKLKPIDAKDVKKPGEYDGDTKHFLEWYALFKDLLKNRNETWEPILDALEEMRSKKVVDYKNKIFEF